MILLKAILIGIFISMPVGPVSMLCIQSSLARGFKIGMAIGVGAAIADAFYAFLIVGWLSIISPLFANYHSLLKLFGSFTLIFIGCQILRTPPNAPSVIVGGSNLIKNIASAFFLTIANPATMLFFAGVFTSLGIHQAFHREALMIVGGIFLGSILWWVFLASFSSGVRHKIAPSSIGKIKIISGFFLMILGIIGLITSF